MRRRPDKAGVAGADNIEVIIEPDTKPGEAILPAAFSKILSCLNEAKHYFRRFIKQQ